MAPTDARAPWLCYLLSGASPLRIPGMLSRFGSIEAAFAAGSGAFVAAGVKPEAARRLADPDRLAWRAELDEAEKADIRVVPFDDAAYPECLRRLSAPPPVLFVRGALPGDGRPALAVVGTRHPSVYGIRMAGRFAGVVSGLARGIDTGAHLAALKAGGRTLAVLGGALDKLYPPENRELAEEIAAHGALISEFPLGREPDRTTFPYRNRVVSGLAKGVLVVEAGLDSGAMNTAEQALEQGRSVMAVPGRVDLEGSQGPHRLIQNGARLVQDVGDILREFEFLFPPAERERLVRQQDARQRLTLAPAEAAVVRALWTEPELDFDVLIRKTGLASAQLMTLAMQLEMKRVLRRLPGRRLALEDEIRQWGEPPPDGSPA